MCAMMRLTCFALGLALSNAGHHDGPVCVSLNAHGFCDSFEALDASNSSHWGNQKLVSVRSNGGPLLRVATAEEHARLSQLTTIPSPGPVAFVSGKVSSNDPDALYRLTLLWYAIKDTFGCSSDESVGSQMSLLEKRLSELPESLKSSEGMLEIERLVNDVSTSHIRQVLEHVCSVMRSNMKQMMA